MFYTEGIFREDESHKTLTICPHHRDIYGLRWRCNKRNCAVPDEMAAHKTKAKGDRGVDFVQSAVIFHHSRTLVPIGSRKYFFVSTYSDAISSLPAFALNVVWASAGYMLWRVG